MNLSFRKFLLTDPIINDKAYSIIKSYGLIKDDPIFFLENRVAVFINAK